MRLAKPVIRVIESLQRLPGIGPRSAERLTYFLLRIPDKQLEELITNMNELRTGVHVCQECFNISDAKYCSVCTSFDRDKSQILVVEEALDVIAVEKSDHFHGVYHVLGGVIDPSRGIGAEELHARELYTRVAKQLEEGNSVEVVLATNPSTEGETTAIYLKKKLTEKFKPENVRITRIARGLPNGGDLDYADPVTLTRAIEGRINF